MAIDCSCDVITHAQYRESVKTLAAQVEVARSFGAAVGVIFRATHPLEQTLPAEIGEKRRCQECVPHIGQAIIEEGLRSRTEFSQWLEKRKTTPAPDKCRKCTNAPVCGAAYSFLAV